MAEGKEIAQFSTKMNRAAKDPAALLALGKSAFLSECYAEAVEAYKQCIALDSRNAAAYYNLGVAWQALGKPREANRAFVKALEIDPKHKAAQHALNLLAAY